MSIDPIVLAAIVGVVVIGVALYVVNRTVSDVEPSLPPGAAPPVPNPASPIGAAAIANALGPSLIAPVSFTVS